MTQTPAVRVRNLTKVFRDFWYRNRVFAVKDLNLEIQRGEVFGLLGPNGSGKSTTIKMLLGLLYPTRGRISLFGKAPTDVAVKARIGFLPEESYLYRFLNARETLDYYGRLFRLPGAVRAERIERLTVRWPTGRTQSFENLPVDATVILTEGRDEAGLADLARTD